MMMIQAHGKRKSTMKLLKQHDVIATVLAFGLALNAVAGETEKDTMNMNSKQRSWTLATEDTELILTVAGNALSLVSLRNPTQNWNWTPTPSPVPMPGVHGRKLNWEFREASEVKTNGHQVTLCFTCVDPSLELKSVWRALPGPGPVENEVSIKNNSEGNVTFGPDIAAAGVDLVADAAVTLHRADKTAAGKGKVYEDVIGPNAKVSTGAGIIPLIILGAGSAHGAYLGFEWELGGFKVVSRAEMGSALNGAKLRLSVCVCMSVCCLCVGFL